jgi:hypothetical protein
MRIRIFQAKPALFAGTILLSSFSASYAFEASDVADRLREITGRQHVEMTYDAPRLEGSNVIIPNVVLGASNQEPTKLGDWLLENVTEDAAGNYRIERSVLEQFRYEDPQGIVIMRGLEGRGVVLMADSEADPYWGMRGGTGTIASMEVVIGGKEVFALSDIQWSESYAEDLTATGHFHAERFEVRSANNAPEQNSTMKSLGLDEITGSFDATYTMVPSTGTVMVENFQVLADNLGKLELKGSISGFTRDFQNQMMSLASQGAKAERDELNVVDPAFLELSQELTFHAAAIRFEDNGLIQKALDTFAKQQDTTREEALQFAKSFVEMMAPNLVNIFGKSADAKLTVFLDDPQNIELSATPRSPLDFLAIVTWAQSDVPKLIKEFNLKLTTNE